MQAEQSTQMFSLEPNEAARLLRRAKHEAEVGCLWTLCKASEGKKIFSVSLLYFMFYHISFFFFSQGQP